MSKHSHFAGVCVSNLTSMSGSITSPNHPNLYPTNMDCMWGILVHPLAEIVLTIHVLHVEEDSKNPGRCVYDYVEVRAGLQRDSTLLARYCGKVNTTIFTRQGNMSLLFVSDQDKEYVGLNSSYTSHGESHSSYALFLLDKTI